MTQQEKPQPIQTMMMIQIDNRAAKVRLNDVVTKGLIDPLIDKIATLYGDDAVRNEWTCGEIVAVESDALETLEIEIDSVGGSVGEGYRLYKTLLALRERGVAVTANITKTAASMGSVIAMAADKVRMVDGGTFMIHDAQANVKGDADRLRQVMNDLESVSEEIAGIYARKTGQDQDAIRECMKNELYMNAATALRYRFVDEVYEAPAKERNPSILERMIGNHKTDSEETPLTLAARVGTSVVEMNIFESRKKLSESIDAKDEQITSMLADIETAENVAKEATEKLSSEIEARLVAESKVSELEASITTKDLAIADLQAKLTDQEAATVEADKSAAAKATAELAEAGHPPLDIENSDGASGKTRYEEYRNLQSTNPRAAALYWDEHADAIKAGN